MTTVNDIQDLVRIIEEHPEWRGELQRVLLTQQLLEVPERLDRLAATVEVLADTAAALVQHAEATSTRLDSIERSVDALLKHAEATDKTLDTLLKHAEATNKRLDSLEFRMDRVEIRLSRVEETTNALRGDVLEWRLTNKIPPLVSRHFDVRRVYPVWSDGFLRKIPGFRDFRRLLKRRQTMDR